MKQYLELMQDILDSGVTKDDRTGTGTISLFGRQLRFDLEKGFPLLTTKKVYLRGIIHELLWFLAGDTNLKYLAQNNVRIWDDWPFRKYKNSQDYEGEDIKEFAQKIAADSDFAKKHGELGPVYGKQWRNFNGIDQISWLVNEIKTNPNSRRLIVSAWNPAEIEEMKKAGLPPCHTLFQFYVLNNKLSCQLYQRSADYFLGVPFNIASYSLLTMMVAHVTGLKLGDFVHTFGDVHLYLNHLDQARIQLERTPKSLPKMKINQEVDSIFDFKFEDFYLYDYDPYPAIKATVSV